MEKVGKRSIWASPALDSRIRSANVQKSEKLLGYLTGPGLVYVTYFVVAGTYLNVFYTDILNIGHLWGGLFLALMPVVSKVIDAITNVIMGRIIDKTKTAQGKARPWLLISAPLLALTGIMLYAVPKASETVQAIWIALSYNLFFAFAFTIYNMSHTLMVPLSTRNQKQRDTLGFLMNTATNMIAGAVTYVLFPMVILPWIGVARDRWVGIMTILSIIAIPAVLLEYYYTKERITEESAKTEQEENTVSVKEQMKACLKDSYWVIYMVVWFIWQILSYAQSTILVYYANWVVGSYNDGTTITLLTTVSQAIQGPALLLLWPISKKFGKRNTMIGGMVLAILGAGIAFINARNLGVVMIGMLIRCLGLLPSYLFTAMLADALDHVEWKSGFRCDGFSATIVNVSVTVGMGIAVGMFNFGLSAFGYVAPAADGAIVQQTNAVQSFITISYFGMAILVYAIVLVLMLFYRVEKQLPQIHTDIIAKHKAEAEARGEVYISFEEKERIEAEEQERIAEEKRIEELKAKCEKKGLSFEEEEAKYQAKLAAKKAKQEKKKRK